MGHITRDHKRSLSSHTRDSSNKSCKSISKGRKEGRQDKGKYRSYLGPTKIIYADNVNLSKDTDPSDYLHPRPPQAPCKYDCSFQLSLLLPPMISTSPFLFPFFQHFLSSVLTLFLIFCFPTLQTLATLGVTKFLSQLLVDVNAGGKHSTPLLGNSLEAKTKTRNERLAL